MIGTCFDPTAELLINTHYRPHWSQAGAIVFLTMRAADSVPAEVLSRWDREKNEWLRHQGVVADHWRNAIETIDAELRNRFNQQFNRCREDYLDECHGDCMLRSAPLAKTVANSLLHFDKERYRMGDFVVMPNHAHCLVAFPDAETMKRQCTSWMRFTAREINAATNRQGAFWQPEPFDHLVRSAEQYDYLRDYIAKNPLKAHLKPCEYVYRRIAD